MKNKYDAISLLLVLSVLLSSSIFSGTITTIASMLLLIIAVALKLNKDKNIVKNKLIILIVLLLILQLVVSFVSGSISHNLHTIVLLFMQILLAIIVASEKNNKRIDNFLGCLKIAILLLASYSIIVFFLGSRQQVFSNSLGIYTQQAKIFGITFLQSSIGGDLPGTINVGSLIKNPNGMSFYVLIAIYTLYFSKQSKKKKIIEFAVLYCSLFLSGSRLAIIISGLIPILIIYKRTQSGQFKKFTKDIIVLLTILLIIWLSTSGIIGEIKNINYNGRLERWSVGIQNVTILGKGINEDIAILEKNRMTNTSMHNSYISYAINFGILPLIVLIAYSIILVSNGYKYGKKQESTILLILLIISISESIFMFYSGMNLLFFMILASLSTNTYTMNKASPISRDLLTAKNKTKNPPTTIKNYYSTDLSHE